MYKISSWLLLVLIIILGVFLRIYRLADFPVHLSHDEVTQLYDAISIAQTGKDIYGNFLPTIFVSIGDYKPPFYTYITSFFYLLSGWNEVTIRLAGAFFGSLLIGAVFLFSKSLFRNEKVSLLASLMTAITPFEVMFARKSFEGVIGLFFMLIGFSCLFTYLNKDKKKIRYLLFCVLSLSIGMYTYFSHAVMIPLLFVLTLFVFWQQVKKYKKHFLIAFVVWFIIILPLIQIIVFNKDSRNRSQAVYITQDTKLGQQLDFSKDIPLEPINKLNILSNYTFTRYVSQFDPMYLFGNGLDLTFQGTLGLGLFYLTQLPFFIVGLIALIKYKDLKEIKLFILIWIVVGMVPSGVTFEPHSPHRSLMVYTMFEIIIALGIFSFTSYLTSHKYKLIRYPVYSLVLLCFLLNFVYFTHIYYVNFPFEKSESMHYPFKQVALFAWSERNNYDQIIFDPKYGESAPTVGTAGQYYFGFYGNYPPSQMQKELKTGDKERELLFDKFSIRATNWGDDSMLKNTLVILSKWSIGADDLAKSNVIKIFYFYDGEPAFYAIKP